MGDEYDDADFAAALDSVQPPAPRLVSTSAAVAGQQQPKPSGVVQPTPQRINRSGVSSIIVNIKQKGNPVLNHIKNIPWEYGDTQADYVIGATGCALFLSLKYHRLHPEYVYNRFRILGKRYHLRILLVLVDIENHTEPLKELAKTCLVNEYTLILAWSSPEAGKYIESFKKFERSPATLIEKHQSTSYQDRLTEFITTPRTLTKTNALELISNFGSLKQAINARPEEISLISGWGEKKTRVWDQTVNEPFRIPKILAGKNEEEITARSEALGPITKDDIVRARQGVGPAVPLRRVPLALHEQLSVEEEAANEASADLVDQS